MTAINSNRAIRGPVTAVPVVAGKGVRLVADIENNRWIVEADETVLWEGTVESTGGQNLNTTIQLSESILNFERIVVYCTGPKITMLQWCPTDYTGIVAHYITADTEGNNFTVGAIIVQLADKTQIRYRCGYSQTNIITAYQGEYWSTYGKPYKVVGVNRIASA